MSQFVDLGTQLPNIPACAEIQGLIKACDKNRDFSIVEVRTTGGIGDIVIVDCVCQEIGNRNAVGIRSRERLAILFKPMAASEIPYSVRALRVGFPLTVHQNGVFEGEPPSLCLYQESWDVLERTWTPEVFLKRIQWWLVHAAMGTLHGPDQPVEQLFFRSPFSVVLPRKLSHDENITFGLSQFARVNSELENLFIRCTEAQVGGIAKSCHVLSLQSVIHDRILPTPRSLGELERQLQGRGSGFITKLMASIAAMVPDSGVPKLMANNYWDTNSLLILQVPIRRTENGDIERIERRGFIIDLGIMEIGVAGGVINPMDPNKYFKLGLVGTSQAIAQDDWKDIGITQVEVLEPLDRISAREMSAISPEEGEFSGMIAGVGALGSSLIRIWVREGWGHWTLVDHDFIRPHNLARHLSLDFGIGTAKAEMVGLYVNEIYPQETKHRAIVAKANFYLNSEMKDELASFDLVIDASTTLGFPRDLANNANAKRSVSTFLTPSGLSSVLMMEDTCGQIRLDTLEAQYYRAIINAPWGELHLAGNLSRFSVGAGCRDISVALSNELIEMHAALLARQIRKRTQHPDASIVIFVNDDDSGSISAHSIDAAAPVIYRCGNWKIMLDGNLAAKMNDMRTQALPVETGGIIVGYKDFKLKMITVVEVLPQPKDSLSSGEFFVRGKEGTLDIIQEIRRRTGDIVDYLGEWHSHPDGIGCDPSSVDLNLIQTMGAFSALEGDPFLMIIACKDQLRPFIASETE